MGFMGQGSAAKPLDVTVLTPGFQASGTLNVLGQFQTYINDDQKSVFPLEQAALYGLEQGNPASSMSIPTLFLAKSSCQVLALHEMLDNSQSGLMPRAEHLAIYTSHYVIQAYFHMGADTPVSEFVDAVKAHFLGATNAAIFPLFQPQAQVITEAPLVYVHRSAVRMHHPV